MVEFGVILSLLCKMTKFMIELGFYCLVILWFITKFSKVFNFILEKIVLPTAEVIASIFIPVFAIIIGGIQKIFKPTK